MKIAIIGYGRMGKAIEEIALQRGHSILLKVGKSTENWEKELHHVDIAIEFTQPTVAVENFKKVLNVNIPLVTGTTGWYKDWRLIKNLVTEKNGSFLAATNFSIGVNIFFEINRYVAQLMNQQKDYKVKIEEIHHLQKLDIPSGTAITLAEGILENYTQKEKWVCEEDSKKDTTSKDNELLIKAYREEGVTGTHTIDYHSEIDSIQLTHVAHSRKGFALGAVLAAEYIINKKGMFTMKDVLNLPQIKTN